MKDSPYLQYLVRLARSYGVPLHEVLTWDTGEIEINFAYDQLIPPFDPWMAFAHLNCNMVRSMGDRRAKPMDFYPPARVSTDDMSDLEKLTALMGPGRQNGGG